MTDLSRAFLFLSPGTCCNYEKKFVAGIMNSLKEFYDELSYLEEKKEQLATLCAFHSLFKVSLLRLPKREGYLWEL